MCEVREDLFAQEIDMNPTVDVKSLLAVITLRLVNIQTGFSMKAPPY